jgi:hypothetical protein
MVFPPIIMDKKRKIKTNFVDSSRMREYHAFDSKLMEERL